MSLLSLVSLARRWLVATVAGSLLPSLRRAMVKIFYQYN
jgi:hypothetical protein